MGALLSEPLHMRLQKELFMQHCGHPFFINCLPQYSASMSKVCLKAVVQDHFSKADLVFYQGSAASFMLIVAEGALQYYSGNISPLCLKSSEVSAGQWSTE